MIEFFGNGVGYLIKRNFWTADVARIVLPFYYQEFPLDKSIKERKHKISEKILKRIGEPEIKKRRTVNLMRFNGIKLGLILDLEPYNKDGEEYVVVSIYKKRTTPEEIENMLRPILGEPFKRHRRY